MLPHWFSLASSGLALRDLGSFFNQEKAFPYVRHVATQHCTVYTFVRKGTFESEKVLVHFSHTGESWGRRNPPQNNDYHLYYYSFILLLFGAHYTLSGSIGKVVASHVEVARSIPGWPETAPIYTIHETLRGHCPWGWECDQSIGSTVSDAIVRSWLWSTATRSSPLGYFSRLLQVVDNWPHILWQ